MLYPFAVQLYSLRREFETDPEAALRAVRGLGYTHVECAGDYGWSQEHWLGLLADTGLSVISAHVALEQLENDFDAKVDFYHGLGARQIVVPYLGPEHRTADGYASVAQRLNSLGQQLAQADMQLCYHNHDFEFATVDGDDMCGQDILVRETDPQAVKFQVDTYWVEKGGRNALAYIHDVSERIGAIHAKELRREDGADVPVGLGDIDFKTIVPLAVQHEWPIIVEFEGEGAPESVKQSAAYLQPLIDGEID